MEHGKSMLLFLEVMSLLEKKLVLPDYSNKKTIPNFSSAILQHFGVEPPFEPFPLALEDINLKGIDKIIIFIIDALSYNAVLKLLGKGGFEHIKPDTLKKMTSVFPSTTTAALTSFFTGVPPAQHGMLGYTLYLKEFGGLSNMIELTPMAQERDGLTKVGFDPMKFLPLPTIFQQLHEAGITGYHITSKSFVNTGLSRMHSIDAHIKGVYGLGDMIEEVHHIISSGPKKSLTYVYWGLIDSYGHRYGPKSEAYMEESYWLLRALDDFFGKLRSKKTAFFIVADHGQIETPWEKEIWWTKREKIYDYLYALPGGEHRAMYLYTHYPEELKSVILNNWNEQLMVLNLEDAEELNLFGGHLKKDLKSRVGELIVIPRDDYAFCFKYTGQEHSMKGRHGGLTDDEMFVPLIFLRK
ncbi:MAG: hypothetical protein PWQ27_911 [Kosmotoga sp.]|nr:hypothetical protein [Kosmotoga sp.]MDK2953528.1 hypothetical protein [Kosmotoga sp.]